MEVNIKLQISNRVKRKMVGLLNSIPCPRDDLNCGKCNYYDACRNLIAIKNILKGVVFYEK